MIVVFRGYVVVVMNVGLEILNIINMKIVKCVLYLSNCW